MAGLKKETITQVINYCNKYLILDPNFDADNEYPIEWFKDYFSFVSDPKVREHLADAFYQARFMYKLMSALRLPLAKQKGIVKFQIVQYASICEAVLDIAINTYYKTEAETTLAVTELVKYPNALSTATKITYNSTPLFLCQEKTKKAILKRTRIDYKTKFAKDKGLISEDLKTRFDVLYDLRNNIHILKAADSQYYPKLSEAKSAFLLMQDFVTEIRSYYSTHPQAT